MYITVKGTRFRVSHHTIQRAAERNISVEDIKNTIANGEMTVGGNSKGTTGSFTRQNGPRRSDRHFVIVGAAGGGYTIISTWNRGAMDNGA